MKKKKKKGQVVDLNSARKGEQPDATPPAPKPGGPLKKPDMQVLECECGSDSFRIMIAMGKTFFICKKCSFNFQYELKWSVGAIPMGIPINPEVDKG